MEFGEVPRLSDAEEDAALRDTTTGFADWVANIIRRYVVGKIEAGLCSPNLHRIIQLLENLPDEGADGSVGGSTETQVIESVASACSQICVQFVIQHSRFLFLDELL
jgi:proteasome activator subunit 4